MPEPGLRFVVVTDRVELDAQIAETFKACGTVTGAERDACHAQRGAELRRLVAENQRYVFTLIHKFQTPEVLFDRADVILRKDKAHRSQHNFIDGFARHMRDALPHASFVGITGTPIEKTNANTRAVFGDYISVCDIQRAVFESISRTDPLRCTER
ncbi:MAG: DEAD/DEAH box helicase family protein [Steroidobacteraceae bacterium]